MRGLEQRMRAVNEFLRRLEAGKEGSPREVIESSILYDVSTPNRFGPVPVRQVAFDVVAVESRRGRARPAAGSTSSSRRTPRCQ